MEEQFGHTARIARYITPNGNQFWYSAQEHAKLPTNDQYPHIRRAAEVFIAESSGREKSSSTRAMISLTTRYAG